MSAECKKLRGPNDTGPDCGCRGDACALGRDAAKRRWPDLSAEEQERVKRLLTPDPDDNLDDLLARMHRAQEIIEGTKP